MFLRSVQRPAFSDRIAHDKLWFELVLFKKRSLASGGTCDDHARVPTWGQMSLTASHGLPDPASLRVLSASAQIAVVAGAGGSLGLMLYAGRRNPSWILLLLFAIWVLSPFVAAVLANV